MSQARVVLSDDLHVQWSFVPTYRASEYAGNVRYPVGIISSRYLSAIGTNVYMDWFVKFRLYRFGGHLLHFPRLQLCDSIQQWFFCQTE
jgi:hypothetical protein